METHKHTHTLNLDLTLPVCYAISLQYFTKKKKHQQRSSAGCRIISCLRVEDLRACPPSNNASGSDRYLEERKSWKERRRPLFLETVFSWCPGGEGRCGLPSSDGSAGETCKRQSRRGCHSQTSKHDDFRFRGPWKCDAFGINEQIQVAEVLTVV